MEDFGMFMDDVQCSFGYAQALREINNTKTMGSGRQLMLDGLALEEIPSCIGCLASTLQRLDISNNNLTKLPVEIGTLLQIKELKLCNNGCVPFSLPPILGTLPVLVNLKLSGNSLVSLPEEIGKIHSMKLLDLSHNQLTEIPDLSKIPNLVELRLEHNCLKQLPTLHDSLQNLFLSFNPNITSTNEWFTGIEKLVDLKCLGLRGCDINEWPSMEKLPKLTTLDLGRNGIATLPDGCLHPLQGINKLFLDNNQLTEIPDDIGKRTYLIALQFHGNQLQEVPLSFRHLQNLETFTIDEENMLIPPREVVHNGLGAIRTFIESLAEDSLPCYRIRLVVLGESGSGKTSLLRRLRSGKNLKKSSARNAMEESKGEEHANRVDIRTVSISRKQQDGQQQTLEFSSWDFCGKRCDITHQFFVAPKSIFIVTVDLRNAHTQESMDALYFWLQSVFTRAGNNASVFIVGTHVDDKLLKEEKLVSILNAIATDFTKCFDIRQIRAVSSSDGTGIEQLKDSLVDEALRHKHVGRITPKPFTLLETRVIAVKEEKIAAHQPPLLTWAEFTLLGASCHIHTNSTLRTAAAFLKDLGILLCYHDENQGNVTTPTIILDPQWIFTLVNFLTDGYTGCTRDCEISRSPDVINNIWKAPLVPPETHSGSISLLREFGIFQESVENFDFIPLLLPKLKPNLEIIWIPFDNSRPQYERKWQFPFLPFGIFHHLVARLRLLCTSYSMWQTGCIISYEDDWASVEENIKAAEISVQVRTLDPRAPLLDILCNLMGQLISNYYPKHTFTEVASCVHCTRRNLIDIYQQPFYFTCHDIENALLQSQSQLKCKRSAEPIPILISQLAPDLAMVQFARIKIDLNDIEMEKEPLASGAYGVIYRGIYNEETVAVKLLRTEGVSGIEQIEIFQEFRKEVSLMSVMNHPNCVQLLGYCYGNGEIGMVMELVQCGDLHNLIHKSGEYDRGIYLKLAFDIAEGLDFLHSLSPSIIHRDLKPANILLGKSDSPWMFTGKLADFGLSTRKYLHTLKERAVETPMWVAPEILSGGDYSTKSDVYAFGVILYEMAIRKLPYIDYEFRFMNQLEEEIIAGSRPDITELEASDPNVAQLIRTCWHSDPCNRPSFQQILLMIVTIAQQYEPSLYEYLTPRYQTWKNYSNAPPLQEKSNHSTITLSGSFMRKIATNPPETVNCMTKAGKDIWAAHKNGDISIWNSDNGSLFRTIIAAHSREIKTIVLAGRYVWTGSTDGMIYIWMVRAFAPQPEGYNQSTLETVKEGYLEPADGSPALFLVLQNISEELGGVPLRNSTTTPCNYGGGKVGFVIQLSDGSSFTYFCVDTKDRDEWVSAITNVSWNLSEETKDLKVAKIAPRRRKDPIISLLVVGDLVYVGTLEPYIRTYNVHTFEFVDEYPLFAANNWKKVEIKPSGERKGTISFLSGTAPSRITGIMEKKAASVLTIGTPIQRFVDQNVQLTKFSFEKLSENLLLQRVSLVHQHQDFLWVIINHFILRYSLVGLRAAGHLAGHEANVTAICGVNDTLWSSSEDMSLRIWNCNSLQCIQKIDPLTVTYSLLHVGNTVWCGAEKDIYIFGANSGELIATLANQHSDPVNSLLIMWNRVIWSSSLDKTICIWR